MLICDRMQSWFELRVLKSRHVKLLQELDPLCFPRFSCSPSHRRSPVESDWETFRCESPLLRLPRLLERPNCLCGLRDARDKMTKSPLSVTRRRPRLSNCAVPTMTALLPRLIFVFGQRRLRSSTSLPLLRLLLASCPALLPPFALTPVIGWFLTVSLLLLSHSDASVVAVENRYPCLFFFCYYPD